MKNNQKRNKYIEEQILKHESLSFDEAQELKKQIIQNGADAQELRNRLITGTIYVVSSSINQSLFKYFETKDHDVEDIVSEAIAIWISILDDESLLLESTGFDALINEMIIMLNEKYNSKTDELLSFYNISSEDFINIFDYYVTAVKMDSCELSLQQLKDLIEQYIKSTSENIEWIRNHNSDLSETELEEKIYFESGVSSQLYTPNIKDSYSLTKVCDMVVALYNELSKREGFLENYSLDMLAGNAKMFIELAAELVEAPINNVKVRNIDSYVEAKVISDDAYNKGIHDTNQITPHDEIVYSLK